jgi:hypothetical protein
LLAHRVLPGGTYYVYVSTVLSEAMGAYAVNVQSLGTASVDAAAAGALPALGLTLERLPRLEP